jgi:hypothetical protein
MATSKDPTIAAVETVHAALKALEPPERQRVLASVYALLEITGTLPSAAGQTSTRTQAPVRPVAIRELIQEKKPSTHPEFITLFAYYREKHQNLPTFSRSGLVEYYGTSLEKPPKNYDRDFVKAVKRGWIHEDGDNSYITSKGLEAVESNFSDSRQVSPKKPSQARKTRAKRNARTRRS